MSSFIVNAMLFTDDKVLFINYNERIVPAIHDHQLKLTFILSSSYRITKKGFANLKVVRSSLIDVVRFHQFVSVLRIA